RAVRVAQRAVRVGRERAAEHGLHALGVRRREQPELARLRVVLLLLGLVDRPDSLRRLDERILRGLDLARRALLEQREADLLVLERRRLVPGLERLIDQRLVDLRALLDAEQRVEPRALC